MTDGAQERSEPILGGPGTQFRRVLAHFNHWSRYLRRLNWKCFTSVWR